MSSQNTSTQATGTSNSSAAPSESVTSSHTVQLSEAALREHDANATLNEQHWAAEEHNRKERLERAARELGFEPPTKYFER